MEAPGVAPGSRLFAIAICRRSKLLRSQLCRLPACLGSYFLPSPATRTTMWWRDSNPQLVSLVVIFRRRHLPRGLLPSHHTPGSYLRSGLPAQAPRVAVAALSEAAGNCPRYTLALFSSRCFGPLSHRWPPSSSPTLHRQRRRYMGLSSSLRRASPPTGYLHDHVRPCL